MVKLRQDANGNYRARKRLPDDVREEYGRLYGARNEAKFSAPKTTKSHEAKRLFGDWIAEVESRIAAIRAERDGTGRVLLRAQRHAGSQVIGMNGLSHVALKRMLQSSSGCKRSNSSSDTVA
jgi:hypothetical protein